MGLVLVPAAVASPVLYTAAHQHSGGRVSDPQRFEAIVGYPDQCVVGVACWTYVKGSRSGRSDWPESWYAHQDGRRVVDSTFGLFVMDPRSAGWQRVVASSCRARCFIDGLGTSSLSRTRPHLEWSQTQWVSRAALVVRAVVHAGKLALPNSVGSTKAQGDALIAAAGGVGSTEGFNVADARGALSRGRIWVQERGDCLDKYHAYLKYRQAHDHFACYLVGHLPWDTGWLR